MFKLELLMANISRTWVRIRAHPSPWLCLKTLDKSFGQQLTEKLLSAGVAGVFLIGFSHHSFLNASRKL
jgi:hypothetical protein